MHYTDIAGCAVDSYDSAYSDNIMLQCSSVAVVYIRVWMTRAHLSMRTARCCYHQQSWFSLYFRLIASITSTLYLAISNILSWYCNSVKGHNLMSYVHRPIFFLLIRSCKMMSVPIKCAFGLIDRTIRNSGKLYLTRSCLILSNSCKDYRQTFRISRGTWWLLRRSVPSSSINYACMSPPVLLPYCSFY